MMLNAVGQIGLASPQAVRDRVGFNSGSPRSQEDLSVPEFLSHELGDQKPLTLFGSV